MYCTQCGQLTHESAMYCTNCGTVTQNPIRSKPKRQASVFDSFSIAWNHFIQNPLQYLAITIIPALFIGGQEYSKYLYVFKHTNILLPQQLSSQVIINLLIWNAFFFLEVPILGCSYHLLMRKMRGENNSVQRSLVQAGNKFFTLLSYAFLLALLFFTIQLLSEIAYTKFILIFSLYLQSSTGPNTMLRQLMPLFLKTASAIPAGFFLALVSIRYHFTTQIIMDHEVGTIEAMTMSAKIAKGKYIIMYLYLSILKMIPLLGLSLCGLGLIPALSLYIMVPVCLYEQLKPAKEISVTNEC